MLNKLLQVTENIHSILIIRKYQYSFRCSRRQIARRGSVIWRSNYLPIILARARGMHELSSSFGHFAGLPILPNLVALSVSHIWFRLIGCTVINLSPPLIGTVIPHCCYPFFGFPGPRIRYSKSKDWEWSVNDGMDSLMVANKLFNAYQISKSEDYKILRRCSITRLSSLRTKLFAGR